MSSHRQLERRRQYQHESEQRNSYIRSVYPSVLLHV